METSGGYVINSRRAKVSFSVMKAVWKTVSLCRVTFYTLYAGIRFDSDSHIQEVR